MRKGYELNIRYRIPTGPVEQGSKVDNQIRKTLADAAAEAREAIADEVTVGGGEFHHEVKIAEWP